MVVLMYYIYMDLSTPTHAAHRVPTFCFWRVELESSPRINIQAMYVGNPAKYGHGRPFYVNFSFSRIVLAAGAQVPIPEFRGVHTCGTGTQDQSLV